ncbi:DnaB-like helicase C-terminal domain-containing protein [Nonomuraea lactucae]|uniref:DnaB-like helicase C-terminal domain-containing protein n=1 Tax=Nonomuraea lactucae TaxID=2249762 RepID=UPI0013B40068|nr:DnaB-like helicase C-terminal domain-containing protein [Nonomuraea lactucae]
MPISSPFKRLEAEGVQFRRGQLALVAAGPGVGKSVFALTLAAASRVPTLYLSADSDAAIQYERAAAMLTGSTRDEIAELVESGDTRYLDSKLSALRKLRWCFESSPTLDDIENHVKCWAAVYGAYPELVVVDNVSDVTPDSEEGGTLALESIMAYLADLARATGAAVIALHHLTADYDDGTEPPPLSALKGKISKKPSLVLNLFRPADGKLGVVIAKNRTGRPDVGQQYRVILNADLSRMSITD